MAAETPIFAVQRKETKVSPASLHIKDNKNIPIGNTRVSVTVDTAILEADLKARIADGSNHHIALPVYFGARPLPEVLEQHLHLAQADRTVLEWINDLSLYLLEPRGVFYAFPGAEFIYLNTRGLMEVDNDRFDREETALSMAKVFVHEGEHLLQYLDEKRQAQMRHDIYVGS